MARRSSRTPARATAARTTASRKPRAAQPGQADDGAEPKAGGVDFEAGVGIVTTLLLLAAILVLDYHMGTSFGGGFFFKG